VVLSSVVAGRNLPAADANGLSDVSDIGNRSARERGRNARQCDALELFLRTRVFSIFLCHCSCFQPYVKVKLLSDAKHRSPVIPRTLNPVWLWDTTVHTRKANVQATTKPSITPLGRSARTYKGDDEEEAALHFELFDQDSSVIVRR
jgi:hypothetical protein